jgi:RND family efflux transporter MFP subunit
MNAALPVNGTLRAVLLVALLVTGCGGPDSAQDTSAAAERAVAVTLAQSRRQAVETRLHSVGRVVSLNTPRLSAEIDARITDILVEEGDAVVAGQELVRLDTVALELARREARAEIERLQVSIANGERRVQRYRDLQKRDVLPVERLDDAETALAADRAALAAGEARLAIVEDRLGKARLLAPFAGMIQQRHASVGDFAKAGMPLLTLTDTLNLRVQLPFPETVGPLLALGQTLFIESAVAPGLVVETAIDQIRPEVGVMNRAVMVISDLQNPGPWRPEATVEADVLVDQRPDAVVVPLLAVVKRPGGEVVYLPNGDGETVREVPVQSGERQNGWIEIREGLDADVTLVADGAAYLSDGARIAVQERRP